MDVDLVGAGAAAWEAFLDLAPHDIYHLPSYVALAAAREAAAEHAGAFAIIARDGDRSMLLPLIIRDVPDDEGARDAASPYGYPGPLFGGGFDAAFAHRAYAAMVSRLHAEGIVSLFVRTHPLLNHDASGMAAVGAVVEHGETVAVDLTATSEELWSGTRSSHRNEIQHAIRAGHRAYEDPDWRHETTFVDIYSATMERVGAGARYLFDLEYVRALRAALGPRLRLFVVDIGGIIAAAGLFTESCGIAQYHLSGADPAFARERPTKLLLHVVRGVMKERGNRVLHLGGGVSGAPDSLFAFKAGFSRQRHPFRTWRVVVDPDRYAALSRTTRPGAEPAGTGSFFPRYRRPGA